MLAIFSDGEIESSQAAELRPTQPQKIYALTENADEIFSDSKVVTDPRFVPAVSTSETISASHSELDRVLQVSGSNCVSELKPCSSRNCRTIVRPPVCEGCRLAHELDWSEFNDCLKPWEFLGNDLEVLAHNLDDDFLDFWEPENVIFTGAGLGLALGMRGSVDDDVREYTRRSPERWGDFGDALSIMGNAEVQIAGIGALYAWAYQTQDSELMDFSRLLSRSYLLTGLSTLAIKVATNTERPSETWNNGEFGFPSAHVSLSFAIAASIEEYYGMPAGIPAYITASMIGWSRIDQRDHDLSDVIFGAVLGYAIAKSVAGKELRHDSRIRMFPWTDPVANTYGAMFEFDF